MKILKNFAVFTTLLVVMLTSCSKEETITIGPDKETVLEANSNVANLMQRIALKDGSGDNILDNANCFDIKLPVTVFVRDLEIIVDSKEDFKTIEDLFDESDDDDDSIQFKFPITIILNDFTEVPIANEIEFKEYADLCNDENEEDEDIECVDFQYPIEVAVFNSLTEQTDMISIDDDKEMHDFLETIDDNYIVTIQFPVILILADGSEVTADNMNQLEHMIDDARDDCDEDDDYDYNDDDCMNCNQHQVREILATGCNTWYVDALEIDGDDFENNYDGYFLNFHEDGTLIVTYGVNEYQGTWEATGEGNNTHLTIEVDGLSHFNFEWTIYEMKPDHDGKEIKLRFGDNKLELKAKCGEEDDHYDNNCMDCTQDQIHELLSFGCNTWYVDALEINGEDLDDIYNGYLFYFSEDGTLSVKHGYDEYQGTWLVSKEGNNIYVKFDIDGLPNFNYTWKVYEIKPDPYGKEIKLRFGDDKLEFKSQCDDNDDNHDNNCMDCTQDQISELLSLGCNTWYVDALEINGYDLGGNYDGYLFYFNQDGTLTVKYGYDEYQGTWMVSEEGYNIYVKIEVNGLPDFNYEWMVYEIKPDPYGKEIKFKLGDNKLELKSQCDDNDCYDCNQDTYYELLTQGCNKWIVDKLEINGYGMDSDYYGYFFYFYENGMLSVKNNAYTYDGSWEIKGEGNTKYLKIEVYDLPDFNQEWMIYEIKTDPHGKEIKLRNGDDMLEFKSDCGNSNCYDCTTYDAHYVLSQGCNKWMVDDIEINGYDLDSNYLEYYFYFNEDGSVSVEYNYDTYNGTWGVSGEGYNLILTLYIEGLDDFNSEWYIEELKPEDDKEIHLRSGNNILKFKGSCSN